MYPAKNKNKISFCLLKLFVFLRHKIKEWLIRSNGIEGISTALYFFVGNTIMNYSFVVSFSYDYFDIS